MFDVLVNWAIVIAWIFGGCCSNVYALEAIIRDEPDNGLLITFAQFVLTALMSYPSHFSPHPSRLCLKPRAVPLLRWVPNIIMFFTVNMLNNYAFGYNISVPVHIILRSGGSVMTMVVGYAWGKRYTPSQGEGSYGFGNALDLDDDAENDIVSSVFLLTTGIVMAAMADARSKGKTTSASPSAFSLTSIDSELLTGLLILFFAQLLSALMGLYVQLTYAKYGSHWHENLFYSHALSIPLFLPFYPSLQRQFRKIMASPEVTVIPDIHFFNRTKSLGESPQIVDLPPILLASTSFIPHKLPKNLVTLALNALTQFACIRGVNLLASQTSAVGVSVALNVRKLVSLFISIKLFGNVLPFGVKVGAGVVFASAGLWAWEEKRLGDGRQREKAGEEAKTLGEGEGKKVQ